MLDYRAATALVTLGVAPLAGAELLSYDYIEPAYVLDAELEGEAATLDGDGIAFSGAKAIGRYAFVGGEFINRDLEVLGQEFGWDTSELFAGLHYPLPAWREVRADLYARGGYARLSETVFSQDWDGYGLGAGVRVGVGELFEFQAGLTHQDLELDSSDGETSRTAYELGALYQFIDWLGVSLAYRHGDYEEDLDFLTLEEWRLGARLTF